jgi:hypothetical protein
MVNPAGYRPNGLPPVIFLVMKKYAIINAYRLLALNPEERETNNCGQAPATRISTIQSINNLSNIRSIKWVIPIWQPLNYKPWKKRRD